MKITIVQVPYDSGHRGRRMGAGPLRLVGAGIVDRLSRMGHDVQLQTVETEAEFTTEVGSAFELAAAIRREVRRAKREERLPIVLAGNCISAAGTVSALENPEVVWFDAHADLNTPESTTSGFLDGMSLSVLLGRCWKEMAAALELRNVPADAVWLVGARDLDPAEAIYLETSAVHRIAVNASPETIAVPPGRDVYLHIDLDVLDPGVGWVNRFATPGGFTVDGLLAAIDLITANARLAAAALTAYDPSFDGSDEVLRAAFRITEHLASTAVVSM
jgi:arginase